MLFRSNERTFRVVLTLFLLVILENRALNVAVRDAKITFFTSADHVEVKVGNPFVLLQQSSSQLVSHLLLERQVPPDR